VLKGLGFVERTRGSHHIFAREGVEEILKPYQVKQVRMVILKYKLADGREESDSI
jgi:predicted RNA binding protein YcfA (HicA-like mRNA interferase family)